MDPAKALLGLPQQPQGLANSQILDNFLPEKKNLNLQYQQGKGLELHNPNNPGIHSLIQIYLEPLTDAIKIVSIFKVNAEVISEDNFQRHLSIQLVTGGSLVSDLIAHISHLYLPVLGNKVDENVKKLLNDLKYHHSLTFTFQLRFSIDNSNSYSTESDQDETNVSRINKPSDEIEYWLRLNSDIDQNRINEINSKYSRIAKTWKELRNLDFNQMKELLDQTLEVMDDQFINHYPEKRFAHMITIIQTALAQKLENYQGFQGGIIFSKNKSSIKLKLIEAQRMIKGFSESLKQYLDFDWKVKIDTSELEILQKRVNEVIEQRNLFEELEKIPKLSIDIDEIFKDVAELNPFTGFNQGQQGLMWTTAVKKVLISLEQIENDLVNFIKGEVFNQNDNPLKDMQKWSALMTKLSKNFQNDKEQVVVKLMTKVTQMKEEFNSKSSAAMMDEDSLPLTANFSKILHQIVWAKSISGKVKKVLLLAQNMLNDLKNSHQLIAACQDLISQSQQFEQEQFDQWKQDVMSILKNPQNELALQISGKLMEINLDDGFLKVNYSEKLICLIKEVRQLCELGFRKQIPKQIIEMTEIGKRYYKEAMTLKQVANFYNSMSEQITESQRPLLVEQAMNFENVVQNLGKKKNSQITWDNAEELEQYISKVQEAVSDITNENRRLRKIHSSITDLVVQLFEVDLVRQRNIWKDKMDQIRRYIDQGCQGKDAGLCKSWKIHWDYQIFKALEYQYQQGFKQLSVNEIYCDLTLRAGVVEYKPSIEELRDKYYKQIRDFIAYPYAQFVGVGGFPELYKQMPERNARFLNVVYENAEKIFEKMDNLVNSFNKWQQVALIDPEMVQTILPDLESWEQFMKEVRVQRKELERINDNEKIDCFVVNLQFLKQNLDEMLTKLVEGMMLELKNQVKEDCEQIDQFLSISQERLSKRPSTMQEMTEAQKVYMELKGQKFDQQKKLDSCVAKCRLIMSISSTQTNTMQQLQQVQKHWENFELLIGDFDQILSEQTKQIKTDMKSRSKEFNGEIERFYSRYTGMKPKQISELDRETASELGETMKQWRKQWKELEDRIKQLWEDHDHFEMPRPQFPQYESINEELKEQEQIWQFYDLMDDQINELGKEDWLSFRSRLYLFQEKVTEIQDQLKKQEVNKKDSVIIYILKQLDTYMKIYPLLKLVNGENFENEHWIQLFNLLKLKEMKKEKLLFNDLLKADKLILKKQNDIKELQARAQGEITLREAIYELQQWCDTAEFELTDYSNNNRVTPLIKEWKDLMTKVSDNQSLLESLKESKFIKRFQEQIQQFESKLGGIDEYLSKLNIIQRKWVYLEPIFMRGALPQEQGRFKRLDDDYRTIMLNIQKDNKVVSLCIIPGIKDTLDTLLDQLDRCQKALNDFLEEKRSKFPRFYFLGDDDLLEILGQSQNPQVIQMHLKKLFAGINKVEFNKDNNQIHYMLSSQKEQVKLNEYIVVDELVEQWLNILAANMQNTLSQLLIESQKEQSLQFNKYPSQILCLSEEIRFTNDILQALNNNKLQQCKQDYEKWLQQLTTLNNQDPLVSLKIKSLILDLIHHIDIINVLISNNVTTVHDWYWYKQLRFSQNQQKIAQIIMCNSVFDYTYEYQGNAPKLVHTPLTDKCYLTLTQGMFMGYGGNPYGPAGTGKTESVKALGQLFGRQVLVFNCDEGIDFKSMGRIFMGLVKCGAWGCFDEFNRLLEEQLSAISQQIQIIQHAIKENTPNMLFMGINIDVNKNSGIFVTLNPAGKHYGGRSKLPDNLKQLFRPVAMSVPDNELIAEVLLFSEGFLSAKLLAQKVITIFTLSKQLLSPQQHYDWGLRALKTILTVAGQIYQTERQQNQSIDSKIETELLIKSIRINTMSKLTYQDTQKFTGLINDIFPNIKSQDIVYEQITNAIKEVLQSMKLDVIDNQIQKILQFYESTKQRMGVVLVGPSGCGKTTIWRVLKKAHEKLGVQVKTHIMNPKSMPRSQLLGNMNNDTREFSEGVLTSSARQVVKESQEILNWIICDGDIDPEWIESLNSVLDDNHLLTLPTGERISFQNNVNFIFETSDLQYASPATVSRMGMIFLNNEDISVQSVINKFLNKMPEENSNQIKSWIQSDLFKVLEYIYTLEEYQCVPTTRIGLVFNVLSQLQRIPTNRQEFLHYLQLGLSSNFLNEQRSSIAAQIFTNERPPVDLSKQPLDYTVNSKGYSQFNYIPNNKRDISAFQDQNNPPVVMTVGHQRDLNVILGWVKMNEPFIVVGQEGCGKNLLIQSAFSILSKDIKLQIATIHCNSQTGASQIIQKLNQVCLKATSALGRLYKPKECSRLVLYLKDINLPKPDKYQTIQLIAFLQQLITYRGFYDDNLEFVYLDEKIQIVASMNPPTTVGRHPLSTRFTANVRIHYLYPPTIEEMQQIYTEYTQAILKTKDSQIAQMLVSIYSSIIQKYHPDEQRHYLFTPRNLTSIIYSLQRYESSNLIESIVNEFNKNFRDRLVTNEEKSKFDNLINSVTKTSLNSYFATIPNSNKLTKLEKKDFTTLINQGITLYQREHKEISLYLVDEVLQLMSSLNRALSFKTSTSILLAGRSGFGRKLCTQVMATMLHLDFATPFTARDYSLREFKKDLRNYMEIAAMQNKPIILFLEDHVLHPSILETVNSLLASGEIPGLFAQDEIERMFPNPEEVKNEYYGKTLYEAFLERVRKNLKIILSMDWQNPDFVHNCASNPAIFTQCTIIWLSQFSKDSMMDFVTQEIKEQPNEIYNTFVSIHRQQTYSPSPRQFWSLIRTYQLIYEKKIQSRGSQSNHLKIGLNKLQEAKELVDQLTSEAQGKKKLLSQKQKEADVALQEISKAMQNAAERKTETEQLQKFLQEEEGKIGVSKEKVEAELAEVKPVVESAQQAVKGINKSNLDELKSLKMPPEHIHNVLTAVMKVFKQNDLTWNGMKKFLSNRMVIEQIVDFDPHFITPDIRKEVDDVINKYSQSFEKQVIYRASLAAGPLADWVKAVLKYATVLEKIKPLEDQLRKIYQKLESSKNRLKQCEEQLAILDQKVADLKENFAQKTSEAEILKNDLKRAEETVGLAKNLLDKLSDEKVRWQGQFDTISQEVREFPNHSLLSAAYTVYLSAYDENIRGQSLNEWKGLTKCKNYDFTKFMSTESILLKWKSQGLPGDQLSIENSIMVFNSYKVPLLIDPNTQASEWLKKNLESCDQLSQVDQKFTTSLELAVRFGKILVIQELDTIEGMLVPLLKQELIHQGPRWVIMIGEKPIDFNENFRLYLTTRNTAIHLPPDTEALVQVINYTVTKSGLEGKLLSIIINIEQPELEEKKQKLLENEEGLKMQLADLEKALLEELANSTGNILENRVLIDSLNQTKSKSSIIAKSLQESLQLQDDLDQQRGVYTSLAQQGATLFIIINDLQKVNNMYRYSLSYFINNFKKSLNLKQQTTSTQQKLELASINLIQILFNQVASSLFKQDRLMFALHLLKGIKPELITSQEWDFLIGNTVALDANKQLPKWASPDRKEIYNNFMTALPSLQVNFNDRDWESWAIDPECERNFPKSQKLTPFQKVLVVYVFRPERIQSSLSQFVCENLRLSSVSGANFSFKMLSKEIQPDIPCLFVVSAGSDPSKELEEFAENSIGRENYLELSMGGNQNQIAIEMLKEAAVKGQWVCLKNLHLVISFLPILEKTFKSLDRHENFKCWLTTEAHNKFPSILLETCFKVSYEAPPGLKKNMVRILQSWPNDFLSNGTTKRAQMMFLLAWFQALLQERRTYIPQGWSKFYEFSYGDYRAGQTIIENLMNDKQISWPTLYGLFENAIYGGRVDNEQDLKVLRAYLLQYFSEDMLSGGKVLDNQLPQSNQIKDYLNIVNKMSENDNPSYFGLPQNIDKAVQRYTIQGVVGGLKSMSSVVGLDLKFEKDKWIQMLNPLITMWGQLSKIPKTQVSNKISEDPVEQFLQLEIQQSQLLFEKINSIMEQLKQVLFSNGLLTTEIIETGITFIKDQVPVKWTNLWEGPDNVSQWLKGFAKKLIGLNKWNDKKGTLLNEQLDLSELFHPEVFLNALRQRTARKLKIALNELELGTDFDLNQLENPIKLKGLLLQGCGFENGRFVDAPQNLPEFVQLPVMGLCYREKQKEKKKDYGEFAVFTNASREKLLCNFMLPNEGSMHSRIIAGVAIFLSQID